MPKAIILKSCIESKPTKTIKIPLSQNQFAVIDSNDFPLISQYKWSYHRHKNGRTGYATTNINKKTVQMHRLIMGITDKRFVDHKDRNGLNNCKSNLRICNNSQNHQNSEKRRNATFSKYKGISRNNSKKKPFKTAITINGKLQYIGSFATELEAAKAYDNAVKTHYGEFAVTNL